MTKTWLVLAVLLLSVVGCNGTDESAEDEQAAVASISDYWESTGLSVADSECLADRAVEDFGVDHLKDLGILGDDLEANEKIATGFTSTADSRTAATLIVDCLTLEALMKRQYQGIDDPTAKCLADAYGRDRMIEAMAAELTGKGSVETPDDVTAEMRKCAQDQ